MIGDNITNFMKDMYILGETEFTFRGRNHLLTSWRNMESNDFTLQVWDLTTAAGSPPIFQVTTSSIDKFVELFEVAKVFDGLTIYEAESEIKVTWTST